MKKISLSKKPSIGLDLPNPNEPYNHTSLPKKEYTGKLPKAKPTPIGLDNDGKPYYDTY